MIKLNLPEFFEKAVANYGLNQYLTNMTFSLKLVFSDEAWLASFSLGALTEVKQVETDTEADLIFTGADEEWEKVLAPNPEPFYNSIYNAVLFHGMEVNLGILNLQLGPFINGMTLEMRRFYNGEDLTVVYPEPKTPNTRFEEINGRYVYLTIDGIEYRVYYEESGEGIPFLLQHTAGANGQQYRFMMADPDFKKDFRMIAYDLPYHGKSMPPADYPWWEKPYRLTQDFLLKFMDAFTEALELDRPAFIGCSMGGHLAADLVAQRPEKYRATIGIGAGIRTDPTVFGGAFDPQMYEMMTPFVYHNPAINNCTVGAFNEASCVLPPMSSLNSRKEIYWAYATAHSGTFGGDLYYYNYDHNLEGKTDQIDTSKCKLYLMAGDFDHCTPPETVKALADAVEGSQLVLMKGVGHYAMTECYEVFKPYLQQVTEEVKGLS